MSSEKASKRIIRFGTRGSALALAQTRLAIDRLHTARPDIEADLRVVRTEGDIDRSSPLAVIGGRGVFTNAIEQAILTGQVDAAVHSAKDLPTTLDPMAPIVAIPDRDDPRDVLVSRHGVSLERLPANPVIGTSSRRREVQIRRLRPDARLVSIRGNIDTRLKRAESDGYDAIVLAAAGVLRLGWGERICQFFSVDEVVPSPGQGAIAVQAIGESETARLLQAIDEPWASRPVTLERAFLTAIGAGCTMPIGAYVHEQGGHLALTAMMADAAGERLVFTKEALTPGEEAAHVAEIATRMRDEVNELLAPRVWRVVSSPGGAVSGARVVVTRPDGQARELLEAIARCGADAIALPTIGIAPLDDTTALDNALIAATEGAFDWLVFTSANGVEIVGLRLAALGIGASELASLRVAAVGPATAKAAQATGFNVCLVPDVADAEHLAAALLGCLEPGARLLYPRSAQGRETLPAALRGAGVDIVVIDAYQTVAKTAGDVEALACVRAGSVDAITFSSPSSVRGLLSMLGDDCGAVRSAAAICAGHVTAEAAREAGFAVVVSEDASAEAMAASLATHLHEVATARSDCGAALLPVGRAMDGQIA